MDEEEAASAAAAISPKDVIPMHYGKPDITDGNPEKFKTLVHGKNPNINVIILNSWFWYLRSLKIKVWDENAGSIYPCLE